MTLIDHLRDFLVTQTIARRTDQAPVGPSPLPPVWRFPENGAVAPGDAAQEGRPATERDNGVVLSLMPAPGIPPAPGTEERRIDGVDIWIRSTTVPPAWDLEAQIRSALLGTDPGGRTDWTMAGLYVVQSSQYRAMQTLGYGDGAFSFVVGYLFETRAA